MNLSYSFAIMKEVNNKARVRSYHEKIQQLKKLSYTEVTKNISQAEYNQTQEEYILSKSPDKYMISLPVKVLMFEGAKDSSPFTYYFYMENDEDLYLMQRKRDGSVVDKQRFL